MAADIVETGVVEKENVTAAGGADTDVLDAVETVETIGAAEPVRSGDALADVEAGLDALETTTEYKGGTLQRVVRSAVPPLLAVALILAVWQLLYAAKIWPDWKLPGPGQVYDSLKESFSKHDVWPSVWHSISHAAVGFGASLAIGTPLGLLVGRVKAARAGIGPILSGLQSLPSVAWVLPALMFFGPTPAMLYSVVLLGAVPSIAVGVVSGLDQVPPLYLRVGRNLGARGLSSVRYVLLPAALPGYLAGLRQGWAFAWRSLLAAEIIVQSADLGHSLGFLLKNAQDQNDQPGAFAAIVLILVVGVAVNQLIFAPLERRVLRSRGLA
jgi:NitT/TauT family transport system permease protein